jgi:GAF domain-containing protein
MLARQHTIPLGKGLVGQAAAMNAPVLVPDVAQSEEWIPSKLLPDTKAEMTVPIASGDNVFGVLDVQHDVVNGLTSQDVQLLQAVANQVAVALQNARLYANTQEQAQQEAVVNAIGQQIQQANTMAKVLQIAAQELGRSLDVERVTVQIHRNKTRNGQS